MGIFKTLVARPACLFLAVVSSAGAVAAPVDKTPAGPGAVVYFDIPTTSLARSKAFYGALLGWTFQRGPTPGYEFELIFDHGKIIGDLVRVPGSGKSGQRSMGVAVYFPVADVRQSFEKAKALGAETLVEPMNVPSDTVSGSFAKVRDPDGNEVGLYSPTPLF